MTKHPLTLAQIKNLARRYTCDMESGEYSFGEDTVRAAADWQLDQDQKKLEDFLEEFSYRGHSADAILELRAFVNNFKSCMRPQQQENN